MSDVETARTAARNAVWACYYYRDEDELDTWPRDQSAHDDHTPDECPEVEAALAVLEATVRLEEAEAVWPYTYSKQQHVEMLKAELEALKRQKGE